MSLVKSAGNIYFVYQFLKKLVTPIKNTDAFKLGIIDEKGKVLKKRSTLKTSEEKEAYTLTDTMIFNLKKLLEKIPGGRLRIASFAAALFLLKEDLVRLESDSVLTHKSLKTLQKDSKKKILRIKNL